MMPFGGRWSILCAQKTSEDYSGRLCGQDLVALSENSVVGPRASGFSPGKDGETGDIGFIVDAAGCSQAENKPLEARPSFQTEPGLSTKINKKIVALGRASWYIVYQSTFAGLGISRFFLSLRFSALLPLFLLHPANG